MGKAFLKNNYLLAACVLVLAVVCFLSVNAPMRFEQQQATRETAVKQRLVKIRAAEERYRLRKGVYTGDFRELTRCGLLADSLRFIPYSDGQIFSLQATSMIGKTGKHIPLMECGAGYEQYLKGLDQNSVANLIEAANSAGRYPGLRIGDIMTPNNNVGNWE